MSRRVFVHVGLPKSGTSYVQKMLSHHKAGLAAEGGLLFPGRAWNAQVEAVRDLRGLGNAVRVEGAWQRLVDEIAGYRGDAVISMEWLVACGPGQMVRLLDSLAPAEVEIVLTARDLARTVPAAWQEFVQNRDTWTWEEFLEAITAENPTRSAAGKLFWSQQDLAGLVDKWAGAVPVERIHVVTVPPPGAPRDLLWQRVCSVLGIDSGRFGTVDVSGNESLGMESAELMRRLNVVLREQDVDRATYLRVYKHQLAKNVLAARRRQETTLTVPEAYHAWIQEESARQIARVAASGVRLVGDLEELVPPLPLATGPQPADIDADDLLEVALEGLAGLGAKRPKPVAVTPRPGRRSAQARRLARKVSDRIRGVLR